MFNSWSAIALAALLLVTTACASGQATFASRFIREGTPAIDLGGPKAARLDRSLGSARATMPPAPRARAASAMSTGVGALEGTSPTLQRSLLALALAPTSQHYLDVASAYTAAGVRDRAFDYLTEGLKQDTQNPALHDALARTWRDWGFPEKALSAANRAVYFAPRSPEIRNTLGTVLWALGQRDEARRTFEAATALDPTAWYAWRNLCEAALTAGETKNAITFCKRANTLQRDHTEATR